ncbi:unnamed protein product [Oppiella nova]|uniref:GDP-fucose protein O-fucosyltransferase 1 n=1 Tax=Oppiella nova TaxID=334625 RepID=A0A7R9LGG7_9ACAR|nr:unnamed protein product [Oppiella nova]CAG2163446.1 unnamed protein product [Oppiella nova]
MRFYSNLFAFIIIEWKLICGQHIDIDPNGYIMYCSCMGRFGNQAEQLLGSLQFAKSVDRTLILPPFIQYNHYKINFIPFDDYFELEPIQRFHRVMTLETFMKYLSPTVWPEESRSILCYSSRGSPDKTDQGCNPLDGNPFNSFWTHIGVKEFANGSVFHSPLLTDYKYAKEWKTRFRDIKVLAFVGAPSAFPTNEKAVQIQKYITLSSRVTTNGDKYRKARGFEGKPYLALHLRHGSDWLKACDLLKENPNMNQLFSSQQCSPVSHHSPHIPLPYELCFPTFHTIVQQIKQTISESEEQIETIYIATDNNNQTLWQLIHESVPNMTLITPTKTMWSSGVKNKSKPFISQPIIIIKHFGN